MELAFLVWGISLLSGITVVLTILSIIFAVFAIGWLGTGADYGNEIRWKLVIGLFSTSVFMTMVNIAVPSEKTAYMMVAAYAAQQIAEDPKVQQLSGKVLTIIENKLDSYIVETAK